MRGNLSASTAAGAIFTAEYFRREDHGKVKKKEKHCTFRIMANEPIENLMD